MISEEEVVVLFASYLSSYQLEERGVVYVKNPNLALAVNARGQG